MSIRIIDTTEERAPIVIIEEEKNIWHGGFQGISHICQRLTAVWKDALADYSPRGPELVGVRLIRWRW